MTLEATEAECAAGRTALRVSLADIEAAISYRYDITGADAVRPDDGVRITLPALNVLSICILVMRNGFTVIGKAAPASPENFDRALGIKLAYEDAVRQVWPLMGYALRERLAAVTAREADARDKVLEEAAKAICAALNKGHPHYSFDHEIAAVISELKERKP